jgi:hypothetical protein
MTRSGKMLRMLKINVRSRLGGQRKRMSVVIGMTQEEMDDQNVQDILLYKTCEKLMDEFGGSVPKEFGFNMELVSIKDL